MNGPQQNLVAVVYKRRRDPHPKQVTRAVPPAMAKERSHGAAGATARTRATGCCTAYTWTASSGNTMSEFAGQPWALALTDNMNTDEPDSPAAWLRGEHTGNSELNFRCDNPELSGWRNGGSVAICVADSAVGVFTAAICSRGRPGDTPACATSFSSIGGFGTSCGRGAYYLRQFY